MTNSFPRSKPSALGRFAALAPVPVADMVQATARRMREPNAYRFLKPQAAAALTATTSISLNNLALKSTTNSATANSLAQSGAIQSHVSKINGANVMITRIPAKGLYNDLTKPIDLTPDADSKRRIFAAMEEKPQAAAPALKKGDPVLRPTFARRRHRFPVPGMAA